MVRHGGGSPWEIGVSSRDAGSVVTARSVVVRGTGPDGTGRFGRGVDVELGGRFEASRLLVEDNDDLGIFVFSASEVVVSDAVVRGTRGSESAATFGSGLGVEQGSRFEASRLLVDDNREHGLYAEGSDVMLFDTVVRGTRGQDSDGTTGHGITLFAGAQLEASRLLVDDNRQAGLYVAGGHATISDCVVRGTRGQESDGAFGRGINLEGTSRLDANRLLVDDNRESGVFSAASEVVISDAAVRGTRRRERTGTFGRGIALQQGSRVEASRLLVDDNRELGLFTEGSDAVVSDLLLRGTQAEETGLRDSEASIGALLRAGFVEDDPAPRVRRFVRGAG